MKDTKIQRFNIELRLRPGLGLRGKNSHTLSLDSNSSTGYCWAVWEQNVPSIVDIKNRYIQHKGDPGTGGMEEWTFTAIAVGDEVVKLSYAPEHDHNPENVQRWAEVSVKVV